MPSRATVVEGNGEMDNNTLWADAVAAVEALVAQRKANVEAACTEARASRSRDDCLVDHQDLLRLEQLSRDHPHRLSRLSNAEQVYQGAYQRRLAEKEQYCSFQVPAELAGPLEYYRWLAHALEGATDADLEALLSDVRLLDAHKATITSRIKANRARWMPIYTLFSRASERPAAVAGGTDAEWAQSVQSVSESLHRLERVLDEQRRAHDKTLRSEVERELYSLKQAVKAAEAALLEAEKALARQPEIDAYVACRIESFIAEQTREKRAAYEAAVRAAEEIRRSCTEQFRSRLETDFLGTRTAEFAPPDHLLRRELEEAKTKFIQQWASGHTREELDPEQAAAVGAVHENVLVTARTGSGKTRTLVTRAAFLVKHCRVSPDELLLLIFNRAAAEETRERLKQMVCDVPHAMTFHALAYAIVHPKEALLHDSPDESQPALSRAFQRMLDGFMDQGQFGEDVRAVMLGHFRTDWERLALAGLTLSREEGLSFRRALAAETLKGDYVKSFGEKAIANFLFEHDVPYDYERNHWWNGRNYRPDFTIFQGGRSAVIEYFGLTGDPDYNDQAEAKRDYWRKKPGWQFVEMVPADLAQGLAHFEDSLRRHLEACGIPCKRLSEDVIWSRIRERVITRFAKMTRTFVIRCRQLGLAPAALADRIARHQSLCEVEDTFLLLATELFSAYLARLASEGEEDFAGLLERAARALEGGQTIFDRKSGRGDLSQIRFVMIDEFQDFSPLFFRMLQAARQHNPRMHVFCVGDDWQAINAFAGSDLQYFDRFQEYFAPAIRLPIATNYRSTARVVEVGNALMVGQGIQARPRTADAGLVLIADLAGFEPSALERESYPGVAVTPVVHRILSRALKGGGTVALLARRNHLPYFVSKDATKDATLETADRLWTKGRTDEEKKRINVKTAHKYKGLEAETVVILDAIERRYPLIHPDWVFTRVLGDSVKKLIGDERRLFYVACTRAVKTLIVITESDRESQFLGGIKDSCDTLEWQNFPQDTGSACHWVVKVGSQDGQGSRPTFEVKEDLKAHGFAFFNDKEWPYWARTYPSEDNRVHALVSLLREQDWAKKGNGLVVRICDQNENVRIMYSVDGGDFTTTGKC